MKKSVYIRRLIAVVSLLLVAGLLFASSKLPDSHAGFIDKTGKLVFSIPDGCSADEFSEGLVAVRKGKFWGYMNKSGQWVIPPQFKHARRFSQGLAGVYLDRENKFAYIDKGARGVIELDATAIGDFNEGLAMVAKGDLVGYIDQSGSFVIPQKYLYKGERHFSLGVVPVAQADPLRWCYIDRSNRPVINKSFYGAKEVMDGLAPVASRKNTSGKELWGYLGTNGNNFAIDPQYSEAEPFYDGVACVQTVPGENNSAQLQFIDEKNASLPIKLLEPARFSESLAAVAALDQSGKKKYGYVDRAGNFVIPPRFDEAGNFSEGLAYTSNVGSKLAE